jgi:hypothetical protein
MSIGEHVYRQTYVVGLGISQKTVERRHGFRQRVRPYQNFQFNSSSHPTSLRQSQRNNICLTQRNSLHRRWSIRFSGHFSSLVWSNSRLWWVHSTGVNPAQLNCDVYVNLRRQNYVDGTRVSTGGYVSPIQMTRITQGKLSRKAPAHEGRSCSRHNRHRHSRHARRFHHADARVEAMSKERIKHLITEWGYPILLLLAIALSIRVWIKLFPL